MKNQITTEKILGYVLVAWIIISSGSQHFRIYNAVPTILFLFFLSILYGGVCRKMDKSVLWRVLSIGFILLLNIMVHEKEKIDYGNIGVHIICLCTCLFVVSGMDFSSFMVRYINVMLLEIIVSLICFVYVVILKGDALPLEYNGMDLHENGEYNIVYLTPYYTIGWLATGGPFQRNAGIFWEPGAHAIFINIAILFYFFYNHQKETNKLAKYKLAILVIALLTTQSTSGFIEFILIIAYVFFSEGRKKRKHDKFIVVFMGLVVLAIGLAGGVFDKILYKIGSYGDRSRDLINGLKLSILNPIIGLGYFNNKRVYYNQMGIENMSNGLISFIVSVGWIICLLFLYMLFKELKRLFAENIYQAIIIFVLFIVFYASEPILQYVLFLTLLCGWKKRSRYA